MKRRSLRALLALEKPLRSLHILSKRIVEGMLAHERFGGCAEDAAMAELA